MKKLFISLALITTACASHPETNAQSPEATANLQAMRNMHHNMMSPYTNDADSDFVNHMIPHHQGAVDMAKIELQYGKDPELRKLAKNIISSQQKEIKQMQNWQDANGVCPIQPE